MRIIKKIIFLILLFIPFSVKASGTSNYFINIDILENGDMNVKELKKLDGEYNGVETIIRYSNNNLDLFSGITDDFEGSDIYNGTGIENVMIYDVKLTNYNFNDISLSPIKIFENNEYASVGSYGVYSSKAIDGGYSFRIYMPSYYDHAFVISYTVKDAVVIHDDIAEIAWDIIGKDYKEDISNLVVRVNLPSDSDELRVFSHGPYNGINRIIDKKSVELVYDKLPSGKAIDMRVVFDKALVPSGRKFSNISALDKILEVEGKRADIANKERERYRWLNEHGTRTLYMISFSWLAGLVLLMFHNFRKYDKEYKSIYKGEYYRELPNNFSPTDVSYLFSNKISDVSFSSTILYFITKKIITLEAPNNNRKSGYKFKLNKHKIKLRESEKYLIKFLFKDIGNNGEVTLGEIKNYSIGHPDSFMILYNRWKELALEDAKKMKMFESKAKFARVFSIFYSLTILALIYMAIKYMGSLAYFMFIFIIPSVISIIYFVKYTRKSKDIIDIYYKWRGLELFLNDFGNFKEKDILHIKLWEHYLVFALLFGCAETLKKQMKVKMTKIMKTESELTQRDVDFLNDIADLDMSIFENINSFKFRAAEIIGNRRITEAGEIADMILGSNSSHNSSSGGFGGGSSSGGGGFGGGGSGGGRF